MHIASVQIAQFLDEYLRVLQLLRQAVEDLEEEEGRSQWQRVLFLEVELQVAFERFREILQQMNLNPMIDQKCSEIILSSSGDIFEDADELLRRREGLISELRKYTLASQADFVDDRIEEYAAEGFRLRWERALERLQNSQ